MIRPSSQPTGYDEPRIRVAIDAAIRDFVPPGMMPGTHEAVVAIVADVAIDALVLLCGDPAAPPPRGFLTSK